MLAVVCKTLGGIKALERYDKEGMIDKNVGLHCLGPSIGRQLDGRFLAISLENLRVYPGEFLADDSQKRLDLLKPRFPNGSCPPGFLGFAVNMIDLDLNHLTCHTTNGHGLRETLFYSLFSRLQVYRSRVEMEHAVPCISDGAISLDGGMIRCNGLFYLGSRKDVWVRFPITSVKPTVPVEILEIQEQLKLLQWKQERHAEDILREEALLKQVKELFDTKKEELQKFLNDAQQYISKHLISSPLPSSRPTATDASSLRRRLTPPSLPPLGAAAEARRPAERNLRRLDAASPPLPPNHHQPAVFLALLRDPLRRV
ncbi:hypothetical protein J5N97_026092 [Dioscorea zingiberensis]|uniref:Protein DEFECTIVE IN MERISTEM SILENCING 3 n=1 Tax=Dioscorea zingiberensis TaxID=325984 RepID=A0A9D5H669_9LILI|nr:hypothetical protein J5N97_026092 [Dioscorea zingiberensis]